MKANMSYQKKRTLIIIAIIAALAVIATIGTVVYIRGNRRAAAATPEEISNIGNPADTGNNGNNGSSPTRLPQLGEGDNNPAGNEENANPATAAAPGATTAPTTNAGDTTNNRTGRTTTNTNGGTTNTPNGQYTQTTVIPGGGDTVLVAETDARSWKQVGADKNAANAELNVDVEGKLPNLSKTKYAIMHGNDEDNAIQEGETITYVIEMTNNGEEKASNIYIYDTVPVGTELVNGTAALYSVDNDEETKIATATVKENLLSWKVDAIDAGKTIRAKFDTVATLRDDNGNTVTKIINTAIANGEEITPTVTTPAVTAAKTASLVDGNTVTLLGDSDTVKAGQIIRYTITVTNTGDAEGSITVSDTVPEGTEYVPDSLKDSRGNALDAKFFTEGIVVNVPASGSESVNFDVKVSNNTKTTIKNVAKVGDKDDITDDEDGKKVANITTKKTSKGSNEEGKDLHVSDKITYTLTATNTGNGKGSVLISDDVPANTKLDLSTPIKLTGDDKEYTLDELKAGIKVELEPGESKAITFTVIIVPFEGDTVTIVNNMAKQDGDNGPTNETTDGVKKEYTDVSITKKWNDADATELRGNIEFELYANGSATGNKVTATASDNWKVEFRHLEKHDADGEITYTVKENTTLANYLPNNDLVANGGELINTLDTSATDLNKESISITKTWNDAGRRDLRGSGATFTLYKKVGNEEAVATNQTKTTAVDEKVEFTNLPKYELVNGAITKVTYSIVEEELEGYRSVEDNGKVVNTLDITAPELNQEKISITKVWNDNDDAEKLRTDATFTLYKKVGNADAVATDKTTTKKVDGKVEFTDLPKYELVDGKVTEVTYTIREATIPNYKTTYTDAEENDVTLAGEVANNGIITNTLKWEEIKTSIPVEKVWDDNNNAYGKRANITLVLTANNTQLEENPRVELSSANKKGNDTNTWEYTFENLRKYDDNGNEIDYTIMEENIPEGYVITSNEKIDGKVVITNSLPRLEVTKSIYTINNDESISADSTVADGDIIGYKITVTNTGNVDIDAIEVIDEMTNGKPIYLSYADAQSKTNGTNTIVSKGDNVSLTKQSMPNEYIVYYHVNSEDVQDATQSIDNFVTVKGYYENNKYVENYADASIEVESIETIAIAKSQSITVDGVTTEISKNEQSIKVVPGTIINYTVEIENTGNTLQRSVKVKDVMTIAGNSREVTIDSLTVNGNDRRYTVEDDGSINIGDLAWDEKATILATYTVNEANDMSATSNIISNTASLPDKNEEDTVTVNTEEWSSNITVNKIGTKNGEPISATNTVEYGDVITYTITADNSGRAAGEVKITDSKLGELISENIVAYNENESLARELIGGKTITVPGNDSVVLTFSVTVIETTPGTEVKNTIEVEGGENISTDNPPTTTIEQKLTTITKSERIEGAHIVIAMDRSYSMETIPERDNHECTDPNCTKEHYTHTNILGRVKKYHTKLSREKDAVINLINQIYPNSGADSNNTEVTVIAYCDIAQTYTVGTATTYASAQTLKQEIGEVDPFGATNFTKCLSKIDEKLTSGNKDDNYVIIIGDGSSFSISDWSIWGALNRNIQNIKNKANVFTIGLDASGNSKTRLQELVSGIGTYMDSTASTDAISSAIESIRRIIINNGNPQQGKTQNGILTLDSRAYADENHPVVVKINGSEYKTYTSLDTSKTIDFKEYTIPANATVEVSYFIQ